MQTEGGKYSNPLKPAALGLIEKLEDTQLAMIFITVLQRKKEK